MNLITPLSAFPGLRLVTLAALLPVTASILSVLLVRFQSRASAATRHLLWLLAFVIMAVSAPLMLWQIKVPVPILPPPPLAPVAPRLVTSRAWPVSPGPLRGVLTYDDGVSLPGPQPVLHPIPAPPRLGAAAPTHSSSRWSLALASLWLAGFGFLVLRSLAGTLRLRGIIRRARVVDRPPLEERRDSSEDVEDSSLAELWTELHASMAPPASARLYLSSEVTTPLVSGLLRPVVLLPESAPGWPRPMLRAALRHELAHLQRHDLWSAAFTRLVVAGYWFHPAAWYAAGRLRAEAEMAADDCVILGEAEPVAYAESLVALVRTLRAGALLSFPAIGMARGPQIEARVQRILHPALKRRAPRRWIRWSAIAATAVFAALGLIIRPVAAAPNAARPTEPLPAGEPEPFALSAFRLDSSYEEPSLPPLLDPVNGELVLSHPFDYKIRRAWVEYRHGVRVEMPIGPVRIDYGVPLQRDGDGDGHFNYNGDFPGPGYRQQRAAPFHPMFSPIRIHPGEVTHPAMSTPPQEVVN